MNLSDEMKRSSPPLEARSIVARAEAAGRPTLQGARVLLLFLRVSQHHPVSFINIDSAVLSVYQTHDEQYIDPGLSL